jgi:hypothetical protein
MPMRYKPLSVLLLTSVPRYIAWLSLACTPAFFPVKLRWIRILVEHRPTLLLIKILSA